ncbi:MAG TPA: ABC transporter ATP-binding protein [Pyrinomonadaceae bacterium]|nr:ABC transporter ATP-binding protein [Pyrinomonadaceae bacterium]
MSIEFKNVTKTFGGTPVVDDLSLTINDGEFVVLLGPSGCGKSTTLRMLAGLEEPTSGDILVNDERVNNVPPQHRDLAMVFQNYALYPHMTVAENIAYPLRVRKTPREQVANQVQRVAGLLEINDLLARKPRELSGGERQRVALARAIVRSPRAYLMDEPLSNLDARLRVQMRGELKRLQHRLGTTTVYVTHDQAEAMTLAHRVAVMRNGKVQQFDVPLTIYDRPANRFVAEFVGSPSMNFIEGRLYPGERKFKSEGVSLSLGELQLSRMAKPGLDRVTMGIRPEHVHISTAQRDGWLQATVYVTELMGSEAFVFLTLGKQKVIARAPADFRAEEEAVVSIQFEPARAHFFDSITGGRLAG